MTIRVNHLTGLFRVTVNGRRLGEFETLTYTWGQNGGWYVCEGPSGTRYVLDRRG